ncbi:MAG: serine/threonine-protein phosphatase [Chloroflexi bacterium]|nr:serine/threonine-protein phosphatase [Chloroflexota bacterium]
MNYRLGHLTHPGRVRALNEDNYGILLAPPGAPEVDALFVVADGMGGHQAGEVASAFVVENLLRLFRSSREYRTIADYSLERDDYFAAVLKDVLEALSEQLQVKAAGSEGMRGMGSTGTIALFSGQRVFIGHVGDSRAYLFRSGALRALTHDDHSEGEARNVLTQAIGAGAALRVDRSIHAVQAGDYLFLCTDGLTTMVNDAEIQQAIVAQKEPQAICNSLVALANQRGGPDNVTALAARLEANGAGPQSPVVFSSAPQPAAPVAQHDTLPVGRNAVRSQPASAAPRRRPAPGRSLVLLVVLLSAVSGATTLAVVSYLNYTEKTTAAMAVIVAVINLCVGAIAGAMLMKRSTRA